MIDPELDLIEKNLCTEHVISDDEQTDTAFGELIPQTTLDTLDLISHGHCGSLVFGEYGLLETFRRNKKVLTDSTIKKVRLLGCETACSIQGRIVANELASLFENKISFWGVSHNIGCFHFERRTFKTHFATTILVELNGLDPNESVCAGESDCSADDLSKSAVRELLSWADQEKLLRLAITHLSSGEPPKFFPGLLLKPDLRLKSRHEGHDFTVAFLDRFRLVRFEGLDGYEHSLYRLDTIARESIIGRLIVPGRVDSWR